MDPSRNMKIYRNILATSRPPLIPFFRTRLRGVHGASRTQPRLRAHPVAVLMKDLTFIYEGNTATVDGLHNFDKLRMLSRQIRAACRFRTVPYDQATLLIDGKKRRSTINAIGAPHSDEGTSNVGSGDSARLVAQYMRQLMVIDDQHKLSKMSREREAQGGSRGRRSRAKSGTT